MKTSRSSLVKKCVMTLAAVLLAASAAFAEAAYEEPMDLNTDKDVGYGAEMSFLTWHGYLNFEFDKKMADDAHSNFDMHELYLSAHSQLSERVSLTAEFEYEHAPEKLILPIQAFADFQLCKAATFRAGIFYTPMGIPRTYTLRGNKNRMIRQVALTHDIMYENWSEVGVNLFGELGMGLFYDVAVGNGMPYTLGTGDSWFDAKDGLQSHTEDNNENKALHARAGYHTKALPGMDLVVGGSFGTQKYDPDAEKEMTHMGADLRLLHASGLRLQAEVMQRSGDNINDSLAEAGATAIDAMGWYAQVSMRFVVNNNAWIKYVEPVVQVDGIDLNTDVDNNNDKMTIAPGIIYCPEENYLIKAEYDIVQEVNGDAVDNDLLWLSVVVEF